MKFAIIIAALCIGLGAAHTQEEIERKGREIMEEYRRDRGHWIFLNSQGMVDHMVDHIGANGLAFAGFFISKKHYRDAEPGEETQMKDPLFVEFKKMAKDQSWLDECCAGMSHKTWTFGFGPSFPTEKPIGVPYRNEVDKIQRHDTMYTAVRKHVCSVQVCSVYRQCYACTHPCK